MEYAVVGTNASTVEFDTTDWKTIVSYRNKNPKAESLTAQKPNKQTEKPQAQPLPPLHPKKRLPRLPEEDYKIIYRPTGGVDFTRYTEKSIRHAIATASGITATEADKDQSRTNSAKNVFTISTPVQANALRYVTVKQIKIEGKDVIMTSYIAPPDRALQGIIYRAYDGETQQEMMTEFHKRNPEIVQARTMGRTSKSLLLHFDADELPDSIVYFGVLYPVYPFIPKVEACTNCRRVGHRRDVCPEPPQQRCPYCGNQHLKEEICDPVCIVCGGGHRTGDNSCKKRFQRPQTKTSEHQSRSKSRTCDDATSTQRKDRSSSFPSLDSGRSSSRSGGGNSTSSRTQSPGPKQVSWAGVASHGKGTELQSLQSKLDQALHHIQMLTDRIKHLEQENSKLKAPTNSKDPLPQPLPMPEVTEMETTVAASVETPVSVVSKEETPRKKRAITDVRNPSLEDRVQKLKQKVEEHSQKLDNLTQRVDNLTQSLEQHIQDVNHKFGVLDTVLQEILRRLPPSTQGAPIDQSQQNGQS